MAVDRTVARYGTDSSGRAIWMSNYMSDVWGNFLSDGRLDAVRSKIVIVQGPWMEKNGGGASASAGYHDKGGCIDIRTWNLTAEEITLVVFVASEYAIHFWRRDESAAHGGMDPHAHAICGWDLPMDSGAATQWAQLKNRRDGLARNGPDYERRVTPLVLTPPETPKDYLMTSAAEKKLDQILAGQKDARVLMRALAGKDKERDAKLRAQFAGMAKTLGGVADQLTLIANDVKDDATKKQVAALQATVLQALKDAADVDGADNPA